MFNNQIVHAIFEKRPEQISTHDWWLVYSYIKTLENEKKEAQIKVEIVLTCLLVDATGFSREFDYRTLGYTKPPHEIILPIKTYSYYGCSFISLETHPPSQDKPKNARVFKLQNYRAWDGMPVYNEMVDF